MEHDDKTLPLDARRARCQALLTSLNFMSDIKGSVNAFAASTHLLRSTQCRLRTAAFLNIQFPKRILFLQLISEPVPCCV